MASLLGLAVVVTVLVGACSDDGSGSPSPATDGQASGSPLPTLPLGYPVGDAGMGGRVIVDAATGCVFFESLGGSRRYVIWPHGYSVDFAAGDVLDQNGNRIHSGDRVTGGGGGVTDSYLTSLEEVGVTIDRDCIDDLPVTGIDCVDGIERALC